MTQATIGSSALPIFLGVPLRCVVFALVRTGWGFAVTLVAEVLFVAAGANLRVLESRFAMLDTETFRVRHFYAVALLTSIATVTGNAAAVGRFELLAMLLDKLGGMVFRFDILQSVAALA